MCRKAEPSPDPASSPMATTPWPFSPKENPLSAWHIRRGHGGGTYRFESQANLDAFKANPGQLEPAYGGFCAYGAALAKKFDGDPRYWKIVDGKLYLNPQGRHSGRMVQGHCQQYRQGQQELEPHPRHRRSEALVVAGIAGFGSTARGRPPIRMKAS